MAHLIIAENDTDKIAAVWRSFVAGDIDRGQLQAFQDTAAIQAGRVCEACHQRAVKVIIARQSLCDVCSKIELRKRARA